MAITHPSWPALVSPHVESLIPGYLPRDELHVTLWHSADAREGGGDESLKAALKLEGGRTVRLRLSAVYLSPQVCCGEVELLDAPDAAFSYPFPHITLWVGEGSKAQESNLLPGRWRAGEEGVRRVELPAVVELQGQIGSFA